MEKRKLIGITLVLGAVLILGSTASRAIFDSARSSNGGDTGLDARGQEEEVVSAAVMGSEAVSLPTRIIIPKLNVDAHVQRLGVTSTGNMAAPSNFSDVSWYKLGTVPGNNGSAVMAGHEDNGASLNGVFKYLYKLEPGDDVYVVREDGKRLHFRVKYTEVFPYDNAPLELIFNKSDGRYLNLITCAGDWLPSAKTNDKRLIAFTELVE